MSNWIYKNEELITENIPEEAVGFIYLITNLGNGKKYIGRKLLTKAGTKTVTLKNGNKKKVKVRKESDWKNYYGSCKELKEDIDKIGKENFIREVLYFCNTIATLNYQEAEEQFDRRVLKSEDYYNSNIMIRAYKKNILDKI